VRHGDETTAPVKQALSPAAIQSELRALMALARRTANRGRTHIFLGHPLSDACDKTTVEPGNSYSPGVWTCGVTLWFRLDGEWRSHELLPDHAIAWTLIAEPGGPPVAESRYTLDGLAVRHRLVHLGGEGSQGVDFNEVEVAAAGAVDAVCAVVVRDVGPAGAKLTDASWQPGENTLVIKGGPQLAPESQPTAVEVFPAEGEWDSPAAALAFEVRAGTGAVWTLRFRTVHAFAGRPLGDWYCAPPARAAIRTSDAWARAAADWDAALPARVFAPDPRVALGWERCAWHVLAAMENGLPRIGAVNYPIFWLRDGVIILRALDLMGRGDLARIGNDYLAPLLFSGGFGAEADAPGEGIWALVSHARITGDRDWETQVFPDIRKRVDWILRMLRAAKPLRAMTENRIPFTQHTPAGNVVCLPANNGLIHGRMDWHAPDFYINCWAVAGLRLAAESAARLGRDDLAGAWTKESEQVDGLIARHLLSAYGNVRDPAVAPYPSGALAVQREALAAAFDNWFRKNRLTPEHARKPEPLWTYFEAAQAHNAILLGLREEAWTSIRGMLAADGPWDVAAFIEGKPTGHELLPFGNGANRRGWLNVERALGGNMPHNWTTAEMLTLLRDVFVVEEAGGLTLGAGVPREWIAPEARFGVRNLPTDFGMVSYTVTFDRACSPQIDYHGPSNVRWVLPAAQGR
jgi:hypothetical protein